MLQGLLYPRRTFLVAISFYISAYAIAQPSNDNYANAVDITTDLGSCSSNAVYTTIAATNDLNSASCWNNSGPRYNVWFKFIAPSTGEINVTIDRGGTKGSQRRTQVALWENDGITEVACDVYNFDDEDVNLGAVGLTPGDTFYISVDAFNASYDGTFTLCTDTIVDYDYYEGAIDISANLGMCSADAAYSSIGGSPDKNSGSCWNNGGPQFNRWFKFVAPSTGLINITVDRGGTKGTQRRTQVALWENDGITEVACDVYNFDDEDVDLGAVGLTPGDTFYISVDAFNASYDGTFTLCTDTIVDYDYYEGAIDISANLGMCSADAAYSSIGGSPDKNSGSCWNNGGPQFNRWFKFVAPSTGLINITVDRGGTKGTQRRTQVALWENDGITEVACDVYNFDDEDVDLGAVGLTPGDTFYISVDAFNTSYDGTFTLCTDTVADYDYYEGAIDVTSLIGGCSIDALYTTVGGSADKLKGTCWNNSGPLYNRWFKFTAPASGMINVTVDRGGTKGTQRRTQLALWENDGTTQIACDIYNFNDEDVQIGSTSLIAGDTYYISVDAFNSSYDGSFTLCLEDNPGYDYYEGARDVTSYIGGCSPNAIFTTVGGTPDKNRGSCWNNSGPQFNRWFKFTAPATGMINIKVDRGGVKGTQRRTQLALWESDGLTEIECDIYNFNDEDVEIGSSALTPGNTYYFSVDAFNASYDGSFTLCLEDKTGYDYFEGAIELTDLNNWCSSDAVYSTVGGSPDFNAASCWNNSGPRFNRWFKFQAISNNVTITVDRGGTKGTQRRTQLALWEDDGTTELQCARYVGNDDDVSISEGSLTVGNWYYISVDAFNASYDGSFTLCIDNVDTEYYSINSGDWDIAANWSIVSHAGASAATFPNTGDVAYIQGHQITVDNTQAAAQVRLTVADNNTELLIDGGTLNLQGKLSMLNSGNNFDGEINLINGGDISINDSLNLKRNGGNGIFRLEAGNNSSININKSMSIFSNAGASNQNLINLNGNASLTIERDLSIEENSGIKSQITANNTAQIEINEDLNLTATTDNKIELEFNNSTRLKLGGNLNLGGTAYGILDFNNSSIFEFDGTSKQFIPTFSGSGTGDVMDIDRIVINNTFGAVPQLELTDDLIIDESLTLTQGVIDGVNTYTITISNGATTSGDNANSYIDAAVKFIGNSNAYFPIGDGAVWAPAQLTGLTGDAATEFNAQYYFKAFGNSDVSAPLNNASILEYWDIENSGTSSDANVTLFWKNAARSEIDDYADLVIAHFNSGASMWESLGQSSTTSSDPGTITVNGVSSFSPFTFGSLSAMANPLPISLKSFSGRELVNGLLLEWTTLSEINNDYFTIEKSNDGQNFEELGRIIGQGTSAKEVKYELVDPNPGKGIVYYKLTQTDFNGNSESFKPLVFNLSSKKDSKLVVYPNPSNGNSIQLVLPNKVEEELNISIFSMEGRLMFQKQLTDIKTAEITVKFEQTLKPGIYIIRLNTSSINEIKKIEIY